MWNSGALHDILLALRSLKRIISYMSGSIELSGRRSIVASKIGGKDGDCGGVPGADEG